MKKKKVLWLLLFCVVLFLNGCGKKAMEPEEAGELFIQQLIYGKETESFTSHFTGGEELITQLDDEKETLREAAVNVADGISQKETKNYAQELEKKMQEVATYKVDGKSTSKEQSSVTFTIYGLDYAAILKQTLDELSKQIIANESLADDEKTLNKVTGFLFNHAVQEGVAKKNAVQVKLTMKNVKGKWEIAEDQAMNVYLAFLTGNKNVDEFKVEMSRTIQEAMMQQNEKMGE